MITPGYLIDLKIGSLEPPSASYQKFILRMELAIDQVEKLASSMHLILRKDFQNCSLHSPIKPLHEN